MPLLLDRLVKKLEAKGTKDAYALATDILQKNGYMKKDGTLTEKGKIKQSLPEGTKKLGDAKTLGKAIREGMWRK